MNMKSGASSVAREPNLSGSQKLVLLEPWLNKSTSVLKRFGREKLFLK